MDHTPEPWYVGEPIRSSDTVGICKTLSDEEGMTETIAEVLPAAGGTDRADAERIVACVNACAGYSTEALHGAGLGYFHKAVREMIDAIKLKDAALEACEPAVRACAGLNPEHLIEFIEAAKALRENPTAMHATTFDFALNKLEV